MGFLKMRSKMERRGGEETLNSRRPSSSGCFCYQAMGKPGRDQLVEESSL